MFSLNNSFLPIISPFVSILFLLGLHFIGFFIVKALKLNNYISRVSNLNFQFSLIGIIFISYFLYPIIINNFFNITLIRFISFFIIILGTFFLIKELKKVSIKFKRLEIEFYIIILLFILYFFISISPITNADSLDYHIGVPYYIINNESYPNLKFWLHFAISGVGEMFYTLSLVNGAVNLPGLTQLSAIFSILGILFKKNKFSSQKINHNIILIFISSPVLIFLVASAKPQLIFVAASALIFSLIFFGDKKQFQNLSFLFFINIFLITSVVGKFSFVLSSGLLFLSILFFVIKYNRFFPFALISIFTCSFILLFKSNFLISTYDVNFLESIFSPLPLGLPGYKQLYLSLTSCGYSGCFPYWLIFPKDIYSFTESLGIGGIIILFIKFYPNINFRLAILILFLQIFMSSIFGPNNARWYLEPFVWSLILIKYFGFKYNLIQKGFFIIGKFQSIVIILILFYSSYNLTPGSFSKSGYKNVMDKNADGYTLFDWSNSVLNANDILISTHRSFSLSNYKTIPGDFFLYIDFKNDKNKIYFEELKELKPNYILFYGNRKNYGKLKNCLGKLVYHKKNVGKKSSRNPFNREKVFYDGFIYEFNYSKLPNCILTN